MTDPDFPPFYLAIFYPNIRNFATMTTHTPESTSLQQSTVYLCGTCQHPVEWEQKAVLCEVCDVWFHICCQEIPSTDYPKLDQSDVIWQCALCSSANRSTTSPAIFNQSHVLLNLSDTSSPAELSIDSLDEHRKPILTSSPTKYRPQANNSRPLRIINVNCQSILIDILIDVYSLLLNVVPNY